MTLVTPHVGRKDPGDVGRYVRTWQMEPLPMAALAGLTPSGVELALFDERVERIDFDHPADLVAIAVETYTAKRAYEIAAEYRARGVPAVLGGYHAMLMPEEARRYADSVVVGHAEWVWERVLADARAGRLAGRYDPPAGAPMRFARPDRSIYAGRKYLPLSCVETGRGCPLHCNFCTIMTATGSRYSPRPIDDIVADIESTGRRNVFFIDDNIIGRPRWAKELFRAVAPLKIRWFSQGTLRMAADPEMLDLMAASGCVGVLIGFESFKPETLLEMDKQINVAYVDTLRQGVADIHRRGIGIYGTFIYGYDADGLADYERVVDLAIELGLFMAAFNHLMPFPGTPLYAQMRRDGRLDDQWWLDPDFRFGDVPFRPRQCSAAEVRQACLDARRRFYATPSVIERMKNWRGNLNSLVKIAGYLGINLQLRKEIDEKNGLPLGNQPVRPVPLARDPELFVPAGQAVG